jgi:hypothetical protein
MATFAEILKDEATYPDTAEIQLGDAKIPLGQIRDMSRADRKLITDQLEALTRERNEVKDLATKAADMYNRAVESEKANEKQAQPSDFDKDIWWEPVRNKLTPLEKKLEELSAALERQNKSVEQAAMIWAQDRWEGQYAKAKDRLKGDKYKDWTYEKVRDYAATNKHLDKYGFPSIDIAVDKITEEDRMETLRKEAYEEGLKQGQTKARLASMARPTSSAPAKKQEAGLDPSKNFDDLGEKVMEDPELRQMLAELGAVDPSEILQ